MRIVQLTLETEILQCLVLSFTSQSRAGPDITQRDHRRFSDFTFLAELGVALEVRFEFSDIIILNFFTEKIWSELHLLPPDMAYTAEEDVAYIGGSKIVKNVTKPFYEIFKNI